MSKSAVFELFEGFPYYHQSGWSADDGIYWLLPTAVVVMVAIHLLHQWLNWRQQRRYLDKDMDEGMRQVLRSLGTVKRRPKTEQVTTPAADTAPEAEAKEDVESDSEGEEVNLEEEALAKFGPAQRYGYDKSRFSTYTSSFELLLELALMLAGFMPWAWDVAEGMVAWTGVSLLSTTHEMAVSCTFICVTSLISTVIDLPLSLYQTFRIEAKHGFNKQTLGTFFKDKLLTMALSAVIGLPLLCLLLWAINASGPNFHFYVWGLMLVVQVIMQWLFPHFIAPLFNKFTPLPEGSLKTAIEDLASRCGFPLKNIFVIDGSRRSAHSNAYFTGLCGSRRIVLFDTLIEQANESEIVAVLAHEIGHWKKSHTLSLMVVGQVIMFCQLAAFSLVLERTDVAASFGFSNAAGVPLIVRLLLFFEVAFTPISPVLTALMNYVTRKFEFQADAFAAGLGYGIYLKTGLVKLQLENLGTMNVDPLYSTYHHSHPPLVQRLAALVSAVKKTS